MNFSRGWHIGTAAAKDQTMSGYRCGLVSTPHIFVGGWVTLPETKEGCAKLLEKKKITCHII